MVLAVAPRQPSLWDSPGPANTRSFAEASRRGNATVRLTYTWARLHNYLYIGVFKEGQFVAKVRMSFVVESGLYKMEFELEQNPKTWEVDTIYVGPAFRRQGLSRIILRRMIKTFGSRWMVLFPFPFGNDGPQPTARQLKRFYLQEGFQEFGKGQELFRPPCAPNFKQ